MGLVTASDGDGTHWEGPKDISLVNVYITTGNHHAIHGGEKNELNRPYSIANCDLNYQRVYVCISIYINMYSH